VAIAAVLVAACGGRAPSTAPSASPSEPASPLAAASSAVMGTPGAPGLGIGTPLLVGQRPGIEAALADTASGPVVSVYEAQVARPGPLPLGSGQPVGLTCPPSPVGLVRAASVSWTTADQPILALAGDASAPGPVGIGFSADCAHMTVLAPQTATSWWATAAPSFMGAGVWYLGMAPGDPSSAVAWSPASGQLAMKGGFESWTGDGGRTWTSGMTDPAMPAGWNWSGAFWQVGPGRLVVSRGPGFSDNPAASIPTDVTWDPSAGQVPPLMATGVFRDHVLLGVRDAALESVATDGSGTTRLHVAAWRISAGSRFVAVEGRDLASGAPTLAVSSDGVHFVMVALPAEFARAPTDSVALLALDDRVLLTDGPQTANPADQLIHVWSVPVTGAPPAPPSPTPLATPAIPSPPPAEATSTWTPVTLPRLPSSGGFGGPGGGLAALPGGGFIDFVPASPTRTLVFTSPDGARWTQIGQVTGTDASGMSGPVASDGRVYVALGSERGGQDGYGMQQNGASWVSTDLRTWTKAPRQVAFEGTGWRSVAASPAGFVATGFSEAMGGSPVWFSADGLHWSLVAGDQPQASDTVEATAVIYSRGEFVMVGRLDNDAAAWTSRDGRHWTIHAPLPGGSDVVLEGLVSTPSGFLSLGTSGPPVEVSPGVFLSPVAPWTSSDGARWTADPSSAALFGSYPTLVAAPGGYVAAGTVGSTGSGLWTSRDGTDWVPVAGVSLVPADQLQLLQLLSDGRHVLLIEAGPSGLTALVSSGLTR
jgi:hypothetical protein